MSWSLSDMYEYSSLQSSPHQRHAGLFNPVASQLYFCRPQRCPEGRSWHFTDSVLNFFKWVPSSKIRIDRVPPPNPTPYKYIYIYAFFILVLPSHINSGTRTRVWKPGLYRATSQTTKLLFVLLLPPSILGSHRSWFCAPGKKFEAGAWSRP